MQDMREESRSQKKLSANDLKFRGGAEKLRKNSQAKRKKMSGKEREQFEKFVKTARTELEKRILKELGKVFWNG